MSIEDLVPSSLPPLEVRRFQARAARHRPIVTFGLLPVLGVVFLCELLWGATSDITVLVRMGALVPELIAAGEWWRLGSATLLHGDTMHLAFNAYVLFALGHFLEKVLGSWRTLALYCGAALGGSLVSMAFLGMGVSVGASGALFGFLGGHAVLAFGRTGLVPDAMLPGVRKAALINLGLNVANSLRPNIDWAAHLGGLILGVVLVGVVLRRGLPRLDQADRPERVPWGSVVAGLVGLVWLGSSAGAAVLAGEPWAADEAPVFVAVDVAGFPVTFEVPESLRHLDGAMPPTWGQFPLDPAVVSVGMATLESLVPSEFLQVQSELLAELGAAPLYPEGISRTEGPELVDLAGRPAVRVGLAVGALDGEQVYVPTGAGVVMIEAIWLPERNDWRHLAQRVADTLVSRTPEADPAVRPAKLAP